VRSLELKPQCRRRWKWRRGRRRRRRGRGRRNIFKCSYTYACQCIEKTFLAALSHTNTLPPFWLSPFSLLQIILTYPRYLISDLTSCRAPLLQCVLACSWDSAKMS
jgi:hypothetical protein